MAAFARRASRLFARGAWTDARGVTHFGEKPAFGGGRGGVAGTVGVALAAAAVAGAALATERTPYTGRRRLVLLSRQQERSLGERALREATRGARVLAPDHPLAARVRKIGSRVAAAARSPDAEAPAVARDVQWRFYVVDAPMANAFALPNGAVVVYTGLLRLFPNDAELGMVIAHECAHVCLRHSAEKASTASVLSALRLAVGVLTGGDFAWAAGAVAVLGVEMPFSREMEREADAVGLRLLARACYDPRVAPRVFETLARAEGGNGASGKVSRWASTHPPHAERTAALRAAQRDAAKIATEACPNHFRLRRALGVELV